MKVYIVTAGEYSDYRIMKVFTDKEKAEEYREWCYDANDVETYETEDDLEIKGYYEIFIKHEIYDDPENFKKPYIEITKLVKDQTYKDRTHVSFYDTESIYQKYGVSLPWIEVTLSRYISEENWNEDFYRNKFMKALYDIEAVVKQKISEGFNVGEINELLMSDYT